MAGRRFTIDAVFRAVDKMSAPVAKMQTRMQRFTRQVQRGLDRASRRASKFLRGLKRMTVAFGVATAAAGVFGRVVLGEGAKFEQAITNVGAVALKTRDEIQELEKQALELGATTKFTAIEAANAMEILTRAGFSANDVLSATPAVLNAAAASGLEMAEVADITSNALKGFGLDTNQAARVADVLALASSKTNSTMGTLGVSLQNVASTARQLGVPLEDAVAGVALLQDVGLDASVAGSSMNTMLTKLAKVPPRIAKEMRKYGLSFKDASGNMKSFQDVIQTVQTLAEKSGGTLNQVGVLAELFGLRGQKAATNLKDLFDRKNGKNLRELTKELEAARGSAEKMAKLRMDTLEGDLTLLNSAISGLKIEIFGQGDKWLRGIVQSITKWVEENRKLIVTRAREFLELARKHGPMILNIFVRLARVAGVFGTIAVGIKAAAAAMSLFVAASGPLGLIALALGAIVFFWDEIAGTIKEAQRMVENFIATVVNGFKNLIPEPVRNFLGIRAPDPDAIPLLPEGAGPGLNPFGLTPQLAGGGETVTREEIEVKFTDESGRAPEITRGRPRRRSNLKVQPSGG